MKKSARLFAFILVMSVILMPSHYLFAEEAAKTAADTEGKTAEGSESNAPTEGEEKEVNDFLKSMRVNMRPLHYIDVDGDYKKFQAHQWINAGYSGGVDEFDLVFEGLEGVKGEMSGKALAGENDYRGEVSLEKEDLGFIEFDYKQFRKYFDDTGGVYHPFTTLSGMSLNRELFVDVGKFGIEVGLTVPDFPEIVFYYEHEYKEGAKSRLTWASAIESGVTRKITPSWQEVDEAVDVVGFKASHVVKGITFKGDQHWEFTQSNNRRYEQNFALSGLASDKKIRIHDQEPESDLVTTTVGAEKWSLEDKVFTSGAYRFVHISAEEDETIREFDEFFNPRSFSNPEQKWGAHSDSEIDMHTWVANLLYQPRQWLNANAKFKVEASERGGNSDYPADTTDPPDGIPNRTEVSVTSSRIFKVGESVALRFKAIPKTALYTELDLEQIQNNIIEDRNSIGTTPSANEVFLRDTDIFMPRVTWAAGGNFAPVRIINFSSQYRLRSDKNDYDDQFETNPGATTARSAFIDELNLLAQEITSRVTVKPVHWFQTSFRYVLGETDIYTRVENLNGVEADTTSHTYIYDVNLAPWAELSFNGSFARRTHLTNTPASSNISQGGYTPEFSSGFNTWTFGTDYHPSERFSAGSTLIYTRADNFEDFVRQGLPLGSDFDRVGLTVFLKWMVKKGITVKPQYSFYHYGSNPSVEVGNYNAHLIGADIITEWG